MNKNPNEYVYTQDSKIEITAQEFFTLKQTLEILLNKETQHLFPEKYMFVSPEGKEVKNGKPKSPDRKIVDVEKTMTSAPTIYRTPEGMQLLHSKQLLETIHFRMIETGVAKHKDETVSSTAVSTSTSTQPGSSEEVSPKMEVVRE